MPVKGRSAGSEAHVGNVAEGGDRIQLCNTNVIDIISKLTVRGANIRYRTLAQ